MVSGTSPGNSESAIAAPLRPAGTPGGEGPFGTGQSGASLSARWPGAGASDSPASVSNAAGGASPASGPATDAEPAAAISEAEAEAFLGQLDHWVDQVVLQRQHPISGLLPASTANTVHGNYADAWVRDCVYSIQCV